jgi:hypothetical protein
LRDLSTPMVFLNLSAVLSDRLERTTQHAVAATA